MQKILSSEWNYNIETGKLTNSNEEHGVAYSNGSKMTYHIKSIQLYNCNRGGRRQLKVEVSNCLKRRKAIGSRKLGCQVTTKTKLIQLSSWQTVLEIRIPSLKAYLATHDPNSIFDQFYMNPYPETEESSTPYLLASGGSHCCCPRLGKEGAHPQASKRTLDNRNTKWILQSIFSNQGRHSLMARRAIVQQKSSLLDQDAV